MSLPSKANIRKFNWIEALLRGDELERTPRALWQHHPYDEYNSDRWIATIIKFYQQYSFDLIKITPCSSFGIRDLGALDQFCGNQLGSPMYLNTPIRTPEDWYKLTPLDPQRGYLKQQSDCLRRIVTDLDPSVPVVQTIFSPITQAQNLCGLTRLIDHWHNHHHALMYGLEILAESSRRFIKSISPLIDGIFYVIKECGLIELNHPTYQEACRAIDESILLSHQGTANMLHLHGEILNFKEYCSYPVTILHWDEEISKISLSEGKRYFPGIVSGGIDWPIDGWTDIELLPQACLDAVKRIGRDRFLLSASCVIPFNTPNLVINEFCQVSI